MLSDDCLHGHETLSGNKDGLTNQSSNFLELIEECLFGDEKVKGVLVNAYP